MAKDWKDRLGVVYSTKQDFNYETDKEEVTDTLSPGEQRLRVSIDRKQRKGKTVTLVQNFVGREDDLKELGRLLKSKCGVGGAVKEGEIIIQGEHVEKVKKILSDLNYRLK